jgi:hypothetical protein
MTGPYERDSRQSVVRLWPLVVQNRKWRRSRLNLAAKAATLVIERFVYGMVNRDESQKHES